MSRFFILWYIIVLGASKQALTAFSNAREALKMVFGLRSIRVFSKFSLDPTTVVHDCCDVVITSERNFLIFEHVHLLYVSVATLTTYL